MNTERTNINAAVETDPRSVGDKLSDEVALFWQSRKTMDDGWNQRWEHVKQNPREMQRLLGEGILIGAAFSMALRCPSRAIQMGAKYVVAPALLAYTGHTLAGESVARVWNDGDAINAESNTLGLKLGSAAFDTAVLLPTGLIGHAAAMKFAPKERLVPARDIRPNWDKGVQVKELAEPATGKGDSWTQIYREAFPPEESDSVYAIRQRLAGGGSRLYETRGTDGRVMTFSLFDNLGNIEIDGVARPVFFNTYNATRAGYRGMGLGSKHMGKAMNQLLEEHPGAVVPFEIDHTGLRTLPTLQEVQAALKNGDYSRLGPRNPSVELTPEMTRTNLERLQFYQRLAERTGHPTRVANVEYQMPNLSDPTAANVPAHLLYFSEKPLSQKGIAEVVRSIFTAENGYGLEPSHPIIGTVLPTVGKTKIADKIR